MHVQVVNQSLFGLHWDCGRRNSRYRVTIATAHPTSLLIVPSLSLVLQYACHWYSIFIHTAPVMYLGKNEIRCLLLKKCVGTCQRIASVYCQQGLFFPLRRVLKISDVIRFLDSSCLFFIYFFAIILKHPCSFEYRICLYLSIQMPYRLLS